MLAPLAAWLLFGPRPDRDPAQTPRFGWVALLTVTKDELALVSLKARAPAGVIARVPLSEVSAFDLGRARGVWPLTITFGDGDVWRLEVPRRNKKAAMAVAVLAGAQGAGLGPGHGPRRARVILAIAAAVVVAGVAIGVLSSRGHGASAPPPSRPPAAIGSAFDVQDGNGDTYQVTLVKVVDPAQPADPLNTPDSGTRFVAAVFRITGVNGSPKGDDADNDAALVGSNGQTYTCDFTMRPAFDETVLAEGRSQPRLRGPAGTGGCHGKGGHCTRLSFLPPFPVTQDKSSPMAPSAGEVPRLIESLPATQDSRPPTAELTADSRLRRSILPFLAI
jgi:hypothetical protein